MSKKSVNVERLLLDVVKRYYEHLDGPLNVDGEQYFMDNWVSPIDGCDTLQLMFDDMVSVVEDLLEECSGHQPH